ncbi:hypothetical protein MLD38_020335 [Melastoma candidum]|uniref:Uncharacterized protein n=1 Tax=Melastoma candidum TaxID=119954 RepID=A0ACB9QEG5_9MYRT|nr:hypothetical protein MLD38_020335 [Melastoma candidum]
MDGARRPFDRSRELAQSVKKPRLVEDLGRGFPSRVTAGGLRQGSYRNVEGGGREDDGSREAYQPQPLPLHQHHQELVEQYKAALGELTFNSKPIITNLTIIAGENLPAAKAIAAAICTNILEVPNDQKLPSLYLLDSIVKNIGRDYIKYFAARLPEVFCTTYQQVDPAVHNSMRHLFGTWKGVFLPQTLQMIERELDFGNAGNGSVGSSTSRPDSQSQCPAHSIHVNPKYLELQRIQQSSRATQLAQRNQLGNPVQDVNDDDVIYDDYKVGLHLSRTSDLVPGRTAGRSELRQGRPYVSADTDGPSTTQRHGFPAKLGASGYLVPKLADFDSHTQSTVPNRLGRGISDNWKNSEEEEYMWDTVKPRLRDHNAGNPANARKGSWVQGDSEHMNFEGSLKPASKGGLQFSAETSNLRLSEDISARDSRVPSGTNPFRGMAAGLQMKPSVSGTSRTAGSERFPVTGSLLQSQQSTLQSLDNLGEDEFPQSDDLPEGRTSGLSGRSSTLPSKKYYQDPPAKLRPQLPRPSSLATAPAQPRKRPLPQLLHSGPKSIGLKKRSPLPQVTDHENELKPRSKSSMSLTEELSAIPNEIGRNIQMSRSSGAIGPKQSKLAKFPPLSDSSSGAALKPTFSSVPNIIDESTSDAIDNETKQSPSTSKGASSPVSSLLSKLVAKGLISAPKTEPSAPASSEVHVELPKQRKDDTPSGLASNATTSSSTVGEAPASKGSFELPCSSSSEPPKNIIGFEFKPSVIRELNDAVINELLEELPHRCSICGSTFKCKGLLDKHLRWHAIKNPDQDSELGSSRGWYASSDNWLAGEDLLQLESECTASGGRNEVEPMVGADESQCACILCGELFDDFYCLETNEWMFKGAIHLDIPLPNGEIGNVNGSPRKCPVIHASCITDSTLESLGLAKTVNLENDEVIQDD